MLHIAIQVLYFISFLAIFLQEDKIYAIGFSIVLYQPILLTDESLLLLIYNHD